jgi:RimJ/RimL family protein N-acetyltransferase
MPARIENAPRRAFDPLSSEGMPSLPHDLTILPAAVADRQRLLNWIYSDTFCSDGIDRGARELLDRHQRGQLSLDNMLKAVSNGQTVAAAWGQVLAGRIGVIWPVRLMEGVSTGVGVELLKAIDEGFERQGVVLPLSLPSDQLAGTSSLQQDLLGMAGYQQFATLLVMSTPITDPTEELEGPLQFQSDSDQVVLADILQQTEMESGDLPEIHRIRSAFDILATFEQEAAAASRAWYVVLYEGMPVGCLLLACQTSQRACSIQYMGLAPPFRGRGWGTILVQAALQWGRQQQANSLVLLVDSRNHKAIRLYENCGLAIDREQQFWMRAKDVRSS